MARTLRTNSCDVVADGILGREEVGSGGGPAQVVLIVGIGGIMGGALRGMAIFVVVGILIVVVFILRKDRYGRVRNVGREGGVVELAIVATRTVGGST